MPIRTLSGSTVTAITGPGEKKRYSFVRIDVSSPIGTQRFTDYAEGDVTLNVDGTSQLWTKAGVVVGRMGFDRGGAESVSWLEFPNADTPPTWSTWAMSPGLKGARVRVWDGYFDSSGAFIEAIQNFDGKIDNMELGLMAHLAIRPWGAGWCVQNVPYATPRDFGAGDLMGLIERDVQWGDTLVR